MADSHGMSVSPRVLHSPLQATSKRSELLEFIQQEAGVASLLDVRRSEAYDAAKSVDALLNSPAVRDWLRASPKVGTRVCTARARKHTHTDVHLLLMLLLSKRARSLPLSAAGRDNPEGPALTVDR